MNSNRRNGHTAPVVRGELQEEPVKIIGAQRFYLGDKAIAVEGSHDLRKKDGSIRQVIITFPGMLRNVGQQADYAGCYSYAATLAQHAKRPSAAFALQMLTPFDDKPGRRLRQKGFALYGVEGWKGGFDPLNGRQGSFEFIDAFIRHIKSIYPELERVVLFGNSAGGQLLHRYAAYGNALEILGPDIQLAIGSSNGATFFYPDSWRGKSEEQVRRLARQHGLAVDFSEDEINKVDQWRWGPRRPPHATGLSFLDTVDPAVALRRQLETELYLISGELDAKVVDAIGLQIDFPSLRQGFRREDFDNRGIRVTHDVRNESLADYGRHARTHGADFYLDVLAAELGIRRNGRMISVAHVGHDGGLIAKDREVQAALLGGERYLRTSPLPMRPFEPFGRTQTL